MYYITPTEELLYWKMFVTFVGRKVKTKYHVVISCTRSRALRCAMRAFWVLPKEHAFGPRGKDWLQCLLIPNSDHVRCKILIFLEKEEYLGLCIWTMHTTILLIINTRPYKVVQ